MLESFVGSYLRSIVGLQRKNIQFEIVDMDEVLEGKDNIVFDQRIRFTEDKTRAKYPGVLRRVGYYDEEKKHVFIFLTNNLEISAKNELWDWRTEMEFVNTILNIFKLQRMSSFDCISRLKIEFWNHFHEENQCNSKLRKGCICSCRFHLSVYIELMLKAKTLDTEM